jgi:hypothetical protein
MVAGAVNIYQQRAELRRSYHRLAAAAVFYELSSRPAFLWVHVEQRGPRLTVTFWLGNRAWLGLGLVHVYRWVQCRSVAKRAIKRVRVPMGLKVKIQSRRPKSG